MLGTSTASVSHCTCTTWDVKHIFQRFVCLRRQDPYVILECVKRWKFNWNGIVLGSKIYANFIYAARKIFPMYLPRSQKESKGIIDRWAVGNPLNFNSYHIYQCQCIFQLIMSHLQVYTISSARTWRLSRALKSKIISNSAPSCVFQGFFQHSNHPNPMPPNPKKEPTGCNYLRFPVDNEDLGKFGIRPPHLKQVVCF